MSRAARLSTSIRFPADLHAALTTAAEERGLSLNFLVVQAVAEFLLRLLPAEELTLTRPDFRSGPAVVRLACGHERWMPVDWNGTALLECRECRLYAAVVLVNGLNVWGDTP